MLKLLTERELEVVKLVDSGLSNEEIATALFVSYGTIKSHLYHIYPKLNIHNRFQLIKKVQEETIKKAVINYVKAKIEKTKCLQRNFKQKCNYCKYYAGCIVYSEYVKAWIELQKYGG